MTAPDLGNGEPPQVTSFFYDQQGRLTGQQNPDGTTSANSYFVTGLLEQSSGARNYPVEYTYTGSTAMTIGAE